MLLSVATLALGSAAKYSSSKVAHDATIKASPTISSGPAV